MRTQLAKRYVNADRAHQEERLYGSRFLVQEKDSGLFTLSRVAKPVEIPFYSLQLFDDICPRTTENFRVLCRGDGGLATTGSPLHYKGTRFFRIIPNFIIQGGDVTRNNGTGGECIWARDRDVTAPGARFFPDENFSVKHTKCGLLSMANEGPNTNQSQFFITCTPCPWLDNRNVVFGKPNPPYPAPVSSFFVLMLNSNRGDELTTLDLNLRISYGYLVQVVRGYDVLAIMESMGSTIGLVQHDLRIQDCGELPSNVDFECESFEIPPEFWETIEDFLPDEDEALRCAN